MKITSPVKLTAELYRTNGVRSLYRSGTLLMIRFEKKQKQFWTTHEMSYLTVFDFEASDEIEEKRPGQNK